ncbi:PQQ-binding-like beta-propeller repeat protein [Streptomyces sp. WAC04114]|nr:PQQ-binding-like beta-propeller repeat protein [Streptomyces sp. WAC04114]
MLRAATTGPHSTFQHPDGGSPVPDPATARRVLGDHPFAEIGVPSAVAVSPERGIAVLGGDLGRLAWSGAGTAQYGWQPYRVGVYGLDDLSCHAVVESHWPVHSVAVHPTLPLVAVGTGAYDGGYAFEGELLLIDLASGRSRSMMRTPREILRVGWEDEQALRLLVARTDDDECDEAHEHAYDVVVERPDWSAAPRGSVQQRELTGLWVACERPVSDPAEVRRTVEELAGDVGWAPRRQVWDVRGLPDGRVLACLEGVLAEAWLPDGGLDWCVPDGEGGRQLVVREHDVWVNADRRRRRRVGREWVSEPPLVARLSLDDGKTLGTLTLDSPVTLTPRRDGWLALRPTPPDRRYGPHPRPVALIPPAAQTPRPTVPLGEFDSSNHAFPVRRSSRLLFLDGAERASWQDKWVVEVDPDGDAPRRLFPLDWQSPARHVFGGPGVEVGPPQSRELVHTGSFYGSGRTLSHSGFVVRRSLTDGAVRWEFSVDRPATAVDGNDETVYVAFNSGELVALDAADGTVRWRHRLRIGGHPTVALSLELTDLRRLLIGTVDGRILDCSVA